VENQKQVFAIMSRSKPKIILEDRSDDHCVDVSHAEGVFIVMYGSQPIKIRTHRPNDGVAFRYGRIAFPESGHALRLADNLNLRFDTDQFQVWQIRNGHISVLKNPSNMPD